MKTETSEKLENWARFACPIKQLRLAFPEHAKELDRCVYDVGQKIESCGKPDCNCRMSFEEFHAISNRRAEEELQERAL